MIYALPVQQSSVLSKEEPWQLLLPHTNPALQSLLESQSPSPSPHLLLDVQHESPPVQATKEK